MSDEILGYEYSNASPFPSDPLEMHTLIKSKDVEISSSGGITGTNDSLGPVKLDQPLDILSWLPYAASAYNLSDDINDYIIVPVLAMPSNMCNRNGIAYSSESMTRFDVQQGAPAYATFKGKPTYLEHANANPLQARGIILDSKLRKVNGYGGGKVLKVMQLLSFDRTKDPVLARALLTRELNTFSVGTTVSGYTCSICGSRLGQCSHLDKSSKLNFKRVGNRLAYKMVEGWTGFECSAVSTPAFPSTIHDGILFS